MNLGPGGKQPKMHDTVWNGRVQKMVFPSDHPKFAGLPKGAACIAEERGIPGGVRGKKKDEIIEWLSQCDDFLNETCLLQKKHQEAGQIALFLPKFHCEFNPAELIWANSKQILRKQSISNLPSLEKALPTSFTQIKLDTYLKIYQHCLEEILCASQPDPKPSPKIYKRHRPPIGQLPWAHLIQE
jgi:transposase